jgi:hypothetical protein
MEKIKNKAILYLANRVNAFNPNCSIIEAPFDMDLCGGHLGNVNE